MRRGMPKGLVLAFYGDDFTGSTDVLEALEGAHLNSILFLDPPAPERLAEFPGLRAFGVAGGSRMMSPAQMRRTLPDAFRALKASGAPVIHYKICSTFDSSPTVGSIGCAIEIGRKIFGRHPVPLVPGAPHLGRHVVFGTMFARSGTDSDLSRLDRHATMSRHPITPMDEADLQVHLSRQTRLPIELIDILKLRTMAHGPRRNPSLPAGEGHQPPAVLLFDLLEESDLPRVGRLLTRMIPTDAPLFCVGSSGLEYALLAEWSTPRPRAPRRRRAAGALPILAISGSCSPVTARQIRHARAAGFKVVACDGARLAHPRHGALAIQEAIGKATSALVNNHSVIFHSAGSRTAARRSSARPIPAESTRRGLRLSVSLATILEQGLAMSSPRRLVVCGGDTSTQVARSLGISALQFLAPAVPGAPLCRAHAPGRLVHQLEFVFKGGQIGRDSFFADLALL